MVVVGAGVGTLAEDSGSQLCRGASGPPAVWGTSRLPGHPPLHITLLPFRAERWQPWFWSDYVEGRLP